MAKVDANLFPKIILEERLSDGSDTGNPAADHRALFLGEDGLLHLRDSAGGVTTPSAGVADQGVFTYLDGTVAAAPGTPAAGKLRVYAKTGKVLAVKDDTGAETVLGAGGGGSGALVLLEQYSAAASASLDFTTFISSTYDTYKIEGTELVLATNGAHLLLEMGTGAGPSWDTGNNYEWSRGGGTTGGTGAAAIDFASTGICRLLATAANAAGYGFGSFSLTAKGLQSTALRKTVHGDVYYVTSTGPAAVLGWFGMQWTNTATAVTGLRFIASAGDITSGTIRIYGVTKS